MNKLPNASLNSTEDSPENSSEAIVHKDEHRQYRQSLGSQVSTIEQEARMVLPGIQALLGFQLIAVFNAGFKAGLSEYEQRLHLVALLLTAISTILVLAPAAYHRQANHQISKHFVQLASGCLAWALAPLALSTSLDIFLVSKMILGDSLLSVFIAGGIFATFAWSWFIFPRLHRNKIAALPTHSLSETSDNTTGGTSGDAGAKS